MNYETASEMSLAIAQYLNPRATLVVPNVQFFYGAQESDILFVTRTGYMYEVEIKVSREDLARDQKKERWSHPYFIERWRELCRGFYYAIPEKMSGCENIIPEFAGIIVVDKGGFASKVRRPKVNEEAKAASVEDRYNLARLAMIKLWILKQKQVRLEAENIRLGRELLDLKVAGTEK